MKRLPLSAMLMSCLFLLIILIIVSLTTGAISFSFSDCFDLLNGKKTEELNLASSVILELRLPRTILCIIIGAILGLCGASLQGLFRNPLADPGIIGVSAGAALGAAVAIVLLPPNLITALFPSGNYNAWLFTSNTTLFAFIGSLLSSLFVFRIGKTAYGTNVPIMLLTGVAIGALSLSALGFLQFISTDAQLRDLSMWQLGSMASANSITLSLGTLAIIVMIATLFPLAKGLNALLLGESEARHLGINVESLKRKIIFICALGVGISVAISGMIGFIGLIVPHICRMLIGPNHEKLLPASTIMGAVILLLADIIARNIAAPAEVPIGIITALLGAPFFLTLLIKSKSKGLI